jgi:SAM-dependent methyltransferase
MTGNDDNPAWQVSAAAMESWDARHEGPAAQATALLLDRAAATAGEAVIEAGCGAGNETLALARAVGPTGRVLATDISGDMLRAARARAQAAGLGNIAFAAMDAAAMDVAPEKFDLAFCRMGLMLFPDPKAALDVMFAALKPGGRLALMVFSDAARNNLHAIPMDAIRVLRRLPRPPEDAPGYFRFGAPGALAAAIRHAGFADIAVEPFAGERHMTPEVLRGFLTGRAGGMRALLAGLDDAARAAALDRAVDALGGFRRGAHYVFGQEFLIASARRPG